MMDFLWDVDGKARESRDGRRRRCVGSGSRRGGTAGRVMNVSMGVPRTASSLQGWQGSDTRRGLGVGVGVRLGSRGLKSRSC